MTLPIPGPAPDWRYPLLLEIGAATRLSIRLRQSGAVLTPSSGTLTVKSPSGTTHFSGALTCGSTSYADVPATSPTTPETGWTTYWTIATSTQSWTYRQAAYLVGYLPPSLVSDEDFRPHVPELLYRHPQGQSNWSPQIEAARDEILRRLTSAGRRPWLGIDATDFLALHLAMALAMACGAILSENDFLSREAARWRKIADDAEATLRIAYQDEPDIHRAQGIVRAGAVGRPAWT